MRSLRRRPEMSREPAFQLFAATIHAVCAAFNFGAAIYHVRRVRSESERGRDEA